MRCWTPGCEFYWEQRAGRSSPAYTVPVPRELGRQSCFLLCLSFPLFPCLLFLITSFFRLSPNLIHHFVSAYNMLGIFLALKTQQNEATSLHSNAVHQKPQCCLKHLESCQTAEWDSGGLGRSQAPASLIACRVMLMLPVHTVCSEVLDWSTGSQPGLHIGISWRLYTILMLGYLLQSF